MKLSASLWIFISVVPPVLIGCSKSPTLPISPTPPAASTDHRTAVDMARVTAIEIFPETATLRIGQSEPFSVSVVLGPGIPPSGPAPFWSSKNPFVATVDANGLVKAGAVGDTIIEVRFKGLSATRPISVVDVQSVSTRRRRRGETDAGRRQDRM